MTFFEVEYRKTSAY